MEVMADSKRSLMSPGSPRGAEQSSPVPSSPRRAAARSDASISLSQARLSTPQKASTFMGLLASRRFAKKLHDKVTFVKYVTTNSIFCFVD